MMEIVLAGEELSGDEASLSIWEDGECIETTVAKEAAKAIQVIQKG